MGDAYLFASGTEGDSALEVQPMRARVTRAIRPAITAIELGDEQEPAVIGGIQWPASSVISAAISAIGRADAGKGFRSMAVTP
jgi:hypothetical protein